MHEPNDAAIETSYRDPKRALWLIALSGPFLPAAAVALTLATGSELWLLTPLAYVYFAIPFLDGVLGEDAHNPPEAVVPQLVRDPYYHTILCVHTSLLYASFLFCAWCVGTYDLSWWGFLALALASGLSSVDALIVGHELGHKRSRLSRGFAQAALILVGYGHFRVEHNLGHHRDVATPDDSASSRMGESVYAFALREVPGAIRRGWSLECARLARRGHTPWCASNEILRSWIASGLILLGLVLCFGPSLLLFVAIHHAQAWYGLTQANYVEHYGLLRARLPNGEYEPPAPRHSWNTNHVFSNLLTFHLQRHSDHHAHATRPYQALRDRSDIPRLPNGYPGCFGLAAVPRLWFRVMDPKLLEWAGGDLSKLNIDPRRREQIEALVARLEPHARDS